MDQLEEQILKLKKDLEWTASYYSYNFCHPQVIKISQKLDGLIIELMKLGKNN